MKRSLNTIPFTDRYGEFHFQGEIAMAWLGWIFDGFDEREGAEPERHLEQAIRGLRDAQRETCMALVADDEKAMIASARTAIEAAERLMKRTALGRNKTSLSECADILRAAIEKFEPQLKAPLRPGVSDTRTAENHRKLPHIAQ